MQDRKLILAVGTDDGIGMKLDDHCGQSKYFFIYEIDREGYKLLEKRKNVKYNEDESRKDGDPGKARAVSSVLKDVDVLACSIFGPNIKRMLEKYVCVVPKVKTIDGSLKLIKDNIDLIYKMLDETERKPLILK